MHATKLLPLLLLALVACDKPSAAPAARPVTPAAPASALTPTAAPGAAAAQPTAAPAKGGVGGEVLEKIDAAGYSYLRLKGATGEVWAAVPVAQVAVGAQVSIEGAMPMQNFESKTLKRTWKSIYFGTLGPAPTARKAAAPLAAHGAANPHAAPKPKAAKGAPTPAAAGIAAGVIEKATGENARTVAELFAQKAELAGKQVSVRGKVVKYTPQVLGKNWIHLQDGSGSAEAKNHDVTVTTGGLAAVGQVVTITGKVVIDKDFGSGYSYSLMVEEATVAP